MTVVARALNEDKPPDGPGNISSGTSIPEIEVITVSEAPKTMGASPIIFTDLSVSDSDDTGMQYIMIIGYDSVYHSNDFTIS